MKRKSTIRVAEKEYPVSYLDRDREEVHLGSVVQREFEGEGIQGLSLVRMTDQGEKAYKLGPTTDQWQTVDYKAIQEPLFEAGFELERLVLIRGGLSLFSVWTHPKWTTLEDPLSWDNSVWGKSLVLKQSVRVTASLRPGQGISLMRGFFRMICRNGLFSKFLGLGSLKMSHANFKEEKLLELLQPGEIGDPLGRAVGHPRGVQRAKEFLENYLEDSNDSNQEEVLSIPEVLLPTLSSLKKTSKRYQQLLISQFELMAEAGCPIHLLDIVNGVTSPLSIMELEDLGIGRSLGRVERVIQASITLIELFSMIERFSTN